MCLVLLGPPQQRALLALLLLSPNEVVSRDRLVDALWGERPPATATKLVQVYVSALRKVLVPGVLVTRAPGYVLQVEPDARDLDRFERHVDEGNAALAAGTPARAAEAFRAALALWRGPALADLALVPFAQAPAERLEELRLEAVEDRIEADLALGRGDVVPELEALIAEHPLRERLRGQLMLALYRSGRQAEALSAYRDARRALVDELGIEPGRELRELEQAILRQDAELDAPAAAPAAASGGFVGRERELGVLLGALDDARRRSRAARARRRRARDRQEPPGRRARAPRAGPRGARLRRALLGGRRRAGLLAVGAGAARLRARRRPRRAARPARRRRCRARDAPARAGRPGRRRRPRTDALPAVRGGRDLPAQAPPRRRPLVVGLDDLHAADAPSLLLLRFVAGAARRRARCSWSAATATPRSAPSWPRRWPTLAREPATRVGRVARASAGADTARLLALTMGDAPAADLAAEIHAETQGNPLFAARDRTAAGVRGRGARRTGCPSRAACIEAIGRRLQRQSDACRELLALASVLGREFDPDVIGAVARAGARTRCSRPSTRRRRPGSSAPCPRRAGGCASPTSWSATRSTRTSPRRGGCACTARSAEALEDLYAGNPGPHLAELAHHYLRGRPARSAPKAIDYARRAGDRAAAQHGYEEAARTTAARSRCARTARSDDPERDLRAPARARRRAQPRRRRPRGARGAARARPTWPRRRGGPTSSRARRCPTAGASGGSGPASIAAYVPLLERALAAVGDRRQQRARGGCSRAWPQPARDDPLRDRRVAAADEAVAIAGRIGDPATLAVALEGRWIAIEGPDELAEGLRHPRDG